ncbi:peptide ABC transporter substrate-binding protein [Rhodoferax sp.]|uniref:peptide ABC transporter substrate-binding protein n=1 Tax=Rhodoferax sp. TaxID=50421 RepID=UPI002774121B|nr:peptide ABC transporter substrate-binding protein [Rhodoferax sp.]
MNKALITLLGAVALTLPMLAQSQAAKDTLVIGMSQYPPSLHPGIDPTVAKTYGMRFAYRPIATYNDDRQMQCFLCTEVPTVANGRAKLVDLGGGKKGLTVKFTLHPQAKWGDGTPITTKDVAFTWSVGSKPESGFARPALFQRITKVEVLDDKNYILHMNKAEYDFADMFDFALLPAHLEEPVVKGLANPADYNKHTHYSRAPTTAGLWNGPYRLTQLQSGAFMVFEPNPHWWGQKPHFKRVTLKTIENTATLEANLRSGDVDFISGVLGLSMDQGLAMSKEPALQQKYDFEFPLGLVYEHIDFNRSNPVLKDKRVRQALLLGIDRETLVKQLVDGKFPVAHSWVNPMDPGYDANVTKYPFDTARAKALLDQAGFKPGADGIRVNAAGQRLSIEYMTTAGNKLRELIQQVLQNQWKQIGVEAVIKNVPARTYFGETLKKQQFTSLAQLAWSSNPEEPPTNTLSTSAIPTAENNFGGANYSQFSDPTMDRLIGEVQRELDPAKRKPLWAQMQKIYTEELPVLPLFFRTDVYVVPKWLTGVVRPGKLPSNYYGQETWGVR